MTVDYRKCKMFRINPSNESLVEVAVEVVGPERHVGAAEEFGVGKHGLNVSRHTIPVADPVRPANGVRKLKLMIGGECSEVLDFHVVALTVGVGGTLVPAMGRCSSPKDARVGVRGVVDPDDDALPVVTVAACDVAGNRLIFGEVPGIHDGELAPVPGGASVDLAFVAVLAATAGIAGVLKTSTEIGLSRIRSMPILFFKLTWCYPHRQPRCMAGSHGRYEGEG